MSFLSFLSDCIVPLLLFLIASYALSKKVPLYDAFIKGAKEGARTVGSILPTLLGLMVAVGMLRASGFLDFLSRLLSPFAEILSFPAELVPLSIVKIFSSSAATGILLDLYTEYGTDSFLGTAASLMVSSTETVFYTMSLYFMAAKITKTRWTLPGALFSTLCGIAASVFLAGYLT
jgi:spore maturation protein B